MTVAGDSLDGVCPRRCTLQQWWWPADLSEDVCDTATAWRLLCQEDHGASGRRFLGGDRASGLSAGWGGAAAERSESGGRRLQDSVGDTGADGFNDDISLQ